MDKITTALLAALVLTQIPPMLQSGEINRCVSEVKSWGYADRCPDNPEQELRVINLHCYGGN